MKATKSHVIMLTVVTIAVVCIGICKFTARDSSNQAAVPVPVGPSTAPRMDASNDAERISDENGRLSGILLQFNVAIEFYGRVIDPSGTPLKGAKVSFQVLLGGDLQPQLGLQRRDGGIVYSGDDGSFRIKDMKGMNLTISTVELDGYREAMGGAYRTYGYGSGAEQHSPDPNHPVEFLLIENGTPKPLKKSLRMAFAWDSRPVTAPIGDSGVVLVFVPKRDRVSGAIRIFDWSVEIGVVQGEVVRLPKNSVLIAPLSGYQKTLSYGSLASDPKWIGGCGAETLVFRTKDGKYGRIVTNLYVDREVDEIAAYITVYLNQSGARNLE